MFAQIIQQKSQTAWQQRRFPHGETFSALHKRTGSFCPASLPSTFWGTGFSCTQEPFKTRRSPEHQLHTAQEQNPFPRRSSRDPIPSPAVSGGWWSSPSCRCQPWEWGMHSNPGEPGRRCPHHSTPALLSGFIQLWCSRLDGISFFPIPEHRHYVDSPFRPRVFCLPPGIP